MVCASLFKVCSDSVLQIFANVMFYMNSLYFKKNKALTHLLKTLKKNFILNWLKKNDNCHDFNISRKIHHRLCNRAYSETNEYCKY